MSDDPQRKSRSAVLQWARDNPWLPVLISTVLFVVSRFSQAGLSAAPLRIAAGIAFLGSILLLGAVKIADHVNRAESEPLRLQRGRNIAIGLALAALVLLFYVATMARLGGHALNRPI